jgi:hypothetical protein
MLLCIRRKPAEYCKVKFESSFLHVTEDYLYIARIEYQLNLFTRIFTDQLNLKMDFYLMISPCLFHYQITL